MKYIKTYEKVKEILEIDDIVIITRYNRNYEYGKEIIIGKIRTIYVDDYGNMRYVIIKTKELLYDLNKSLSCVEYDSGVIITLSVSESERLKKLSKIDSNKIENEIDMFNLKNNIKKYNI